MDARSQPEKPYSDKDIKLKMQRRPIYRLKGSIQWEDVMIANINAPNMTRKIYKPNMTRRDRF
jgi:hypothetical protein